MTRKAATITETAPGESGEHALSIDTLIRRSLEHALLAPPPTEDDLRSTAKMPRFALEDALSRPEARPTGEPPPASASAGAVEVGSLPPPAIELHRSPEASRRDGRTD